MKRHNLIACLCCLSLTVLVSVADAGIMNFQGSMRQSSGHGASWSYVHSATSSPMTPSGGWTQYAGGAIRFAMSNNAFDFQFDDKTNDGLTAGDEVHLNNINVDLKVGGSVVANLSINGTMVVSGDIPSGQSPNLNYGFTNYLRSDNDGLEYEINVTDSGSHYTNGDVLAGIAFFQDSFFAGPFNGIKLDNGNLTFAVWGDSRNSSGNTGTINGSGSLPLGFDIFVESTFASTQPVPEPTCLAIFLGLAITTLSPRRRK